MRRAISEDQNFDDFNHGDRLQFSSSGLFKRTLPLMELGIRDEREGRVSACSRPFGELAETGRSLLPNRPVVRQGEPVCLEDANGVLDGRKLLANGSSRWPEPKQGRKPVQPIAESPAHEHVAFRT